MFNLSIVFRIEDNPVIIRFKTSISNSKFFYHLRSIEDNPVIIRFKTLRLHKYTFSLSLSIEGNPVIIRFKTLCSQLSLHKEGNTVLKVIKL